MAANGEHTPGGTVLLGTVRDNDLVDALAESSLHQVSHSSLVAEVLEEVARPHSWLGGLFHDSTTARLLRASPIPVLVLPAEAEE